ncbi:MAG: HEAT repeat domain-containing protein [Cytophagales bacterium]|nr:HEAT repeat domain-containing protein [Cytophagales bacterium]
MNWTDEHIIEYLEGGLDTDQRKEFENQLMTDPAFKAKYQELEQLLQTIERVPEVEAPAELEWGFKAELDRMQSTLAETRLEPNNSLNASPNRWWLQIAAGFGLLVIGFLSGTQQTSDNSGQLLAMQTQIQSLQQVVMQQTLESSSASERIKAVNQIEQVPFQPDEKLVKMLVKTATQDKSVNVRYAAVQALGNFMDYPSVRNEMVRSLDQQTEPLIQIAMIGLLVDAQEKAAISSIKKLLDNEATTPEVKQQAEIAMDILI